MGGGDERISKEIPRNVNEMEVFCACGEWMGRGGEELQDGRKEAKRGEGRVGHDREHSKHGERGVRWYWGKTRIMAIWK